MLNEIKAEMVVCAECGQVVNEADAIVIDGEAYCAECVEREFVKCYECDEYVRSSEALVGADGKLYCEDCWGRYFMTCEICGKTVWIDDLVEVHCGRYNEYWCEACAQSDAYRCDDCNEYFANSDDVHADDEHIVCNSCYDYRWYTCEGCGCLVLSDNVCWHDDYPYCEECVPDDVVHPYHSNIRPLNWHGGNRNDRYNKLFMGVELEIDRSDCDSERNEDAAAIVGAAGYDADESFVCECDGSLDNGFEIISSTATLDFHLNDYGWDKLMSKAVALGYTSHNAGTCGLHVHLDREYFTDTMIDPETIAVIILVNNAAWLKRFSRRQNFQYCKFPEDVTPFSPADFKPGWIDEKQSQATIEKLYALKQRMHGHYVALNFSGHSTIEVRFNRGTLNFETFKATLQFVQMFADTMKHSRLSTACKINLKWFERVAKRRGYTEFLQYLKRRNIQ